LEWERIFLKKEAPFRSCCKSSSSMSRIILLALISGAAAHEVNSALRGVSTARKGPIRDARLAREKKEQKRHIIGEEQEAERELGQFHSTMSDYEDGGWYAPRTHLNSEDWEQIQESLDHGEQADDPDWLPAGDEASLLDTSAKKGPIRDARLAKQERDHEPGPINEEQEDEEQIGQFREDERDGNENGFWAPRTRLNAEEKEQIEESLDHGEQAPDPDFLNDNPDSLIEMSAKKESKGPGQVLSGFSPRADAKDDGSCTQCLQPVNTFLGSDCKELRCIVQALAAKQDELDQKKAITVYEDFQGCAEQNKCNLEAATAAAEEFDFNFDLLQ